MPPLTMGYETGTTALLIENITSTEDAGYEGDTVTMDLENNEAEAEQIIVQSIHEATGLDKQRKETTDTVMDPIIPEREILYEFQDDIIFHEQIESYRENSIEKVRNHDTGYEQQRFEGFINTNDIFSHLVYLVK